MQNKITQAVILSAGLGTRLRSVTQDNIPKVMVPLGGRPLLEWHIRQLKKFGVKDFFINLHYLPEKITDYFGDGDKFGVKISYVLEAPEILGTAGGIKSFEGLLKDHFFVLYGDTFYQVDYGRIADFFFSKKDAIGLGTARKTDHPLDSDLAIVDNDGAVSEFLLKPHSKELLTRLSAPDDLKDMSASVRASPRPWGMSAPYVFSRRILEFIPAGKYYEIDHDLVPDLLRRGYKYYAYRLGDGEFRKDIGTPERYKEMEEYARQHNPDATRE